MRLGDYLEQLRRERGYSQRDLAKHSGISCAEISRIESGKRQKPAPESLKALARALSVEYTDLMQLAGYIQEQREEDKIFELVFRDEESGEVVDVVRGVKEMFRKDETWANVAYRVSHELSEEDRKVLTQMTMAYLQTRRAARAKEEK